MEEAHESELNEGDVEKEIGELTRDLATNTNERPPAPTQPSGPPLWRSTPVAVLLLVIAAGLTVANVVGWGPYQRGQPPISHQTEKLAELEMLILVDSIADYQEEHGRLPQTLEQLDLDFGDTVVEYVEAGDGGFVVSVSKGEVRRSYDSRDAASGLNSPTG
jgi:hypothetical protein